MIYSVKYFKLLDNDDSYTYKDYINNNLSYKNAKEVMDTYLNEYPKWMWNNKIIEDLIEWFKNKNVNLFGIDVYSLISSKNELIKFLKMVDESFSEIGRAHV